MSLQTDKRKTDIDYTENPSVQYSFCCLNLVGVIAAGKNGTLGVCSLSVKRGRNNVAILWPVSCIIPGSY